VFLAIEERLITEVFWASRAPEVIGGDSVDLFRK
jgi:hypothetical protein